MFYNWIIHIVHYEDLLLTVRNKKHGKVFLYFVILSESQDSHRALRYLNSCNGKVSFKYFDWILHNWSNNSEPYSYRCYFLPTDKLTWFLHSVVFSLVWSFLNIHEHTKYNKYMCVNILVFTFVCIKLWMPIYICPYGTRHNFIGYITGRTFIYISTWQFGW